ncbi:Hypothetical protein, putative [Bodo saltans]|uniref:Uncharacterized protein n=1 Tax=Bodo saltans TaxID=75058 RepID=A0A0S4JIG0_BODSA|nr:Hypothetical protein, putative [Bodo saltans]|eukprot:CUG90332.1 Hypothetical protein, putative [Bodo saltans]
MSSDTPSSDIKRSSSIEASAAHFATHSSLTLNSSKLSDVLQLLVNGYNSHEAQIAELQTQVKSLQLQLSGGALMSTHLPLQPASVPTIVTPGQAIPAKQQPTTTMISPAQPVLLPPPPPTVVISEPPPPHATSDAVSFSSPVPDGSHPVTPVVVKRDVSSPSRTKKKNSPAPKSAATGTRAAPVAGEMEKMKQSVAQLQQMLGVHTDAGKEAVRQFLFAVGTSANIQQPLAAAFKPLLHLPLLSAVAQQISEATSPDTYLRGFEAKLELLTTTVEAIAQQQQQALASGGISGAGGASKKSTTNTAQRSPMVSTALATLSSSASSGGNAGAAVDAAARVDIARFAKEIKTLQNDLLSLKSVTAEISERKRSKQSHGAPSEASDSDEEVPESKAVTDNAQMSKLLKRIDALEKHTKRGNASGSSTPMGAGSSLLSPHAASPPPTKLSLSGASSTAEKSTNRKSVGGIHPPDSSLNLAASQNNAPAVDYTAIIHAVEEKAMIANRKLKDSLVASLGSQIDALKRDVSRHDEWIAAHDLVHDELVPTLISRASFVVAGSGGLGGGDGRGQSPKRPASAMLNNVHSPFVPKRDAIIRAGAQNPRSYSSSTRVVVDPYNSASAATAAATSLAQQQQRPHSAMSGRSSKSTVTYKLYQQQPNLGFSGSSPFPVTSSSDAAVAAPQPRTPQVSVSSSLFASPIVAPAGHSAENCVVWDCGWCTASRDRIPQWSGSPTPPHR